MSLEIQGWLTPYLREVADWLAPARAAVITRPCLFMVQYQGYGEQSHSHWSFIYQLTAVLIDRTAKCPRAGSMRTLMLPRYPLAVDDGSSPRRYRSPI